MGRHNKKERGPPQQPVSTSESIRRLYSITAIIMCNQCDKRSTCVNRSTCGSFSDKPPQCPSCSGAMDRKGDDFFCSTCMLNAMKRKKLEELG